MTQVGTYLIVSKLRFSDPPFLSLLSETCFAILLNLKREFHYLQNGDARFPVALFVSKHNSQLVYTERET